MNQRASLTLDEYVQKLASHPRTRDSVTHVKRIAPREAEYGEMPEAVPQWMREALERRGMGRPYVHQADAWGHILRGEHVVVVTPTASGKTLCYNMPIATMLGESDSGCALYLYPTKALAQDQCAELNELLRACDLDERAQVYDGDTPSDIRRKVRESVRAVLSNPDMLHASILPHHEKWRRLFASLRYVVIDEMHTYRGVFGSHVGNVLRRLRRICRHYGTDPLFVFTSATIANPPELAEQLIAEPVAEVNRSGAPAGEKLFVLYNPPIIDGDLERRQSPGAAAHRLLSSLLGHGHASIAFTRSRQGVEILTRRLKESFEARRKEHIAERIAGYRGGYLPNERRRIEKGLRKGEILGVVSTNALELGIDIGALDVCVIASYPGTIASTWQQAGRAGRRKTTSLSVLIAGDDPVDQYLVNHPEFFFDASPEHGRIDPDNLRILAEHLKCAVYELPFPPGEAWGGFSAEDTQEILAFLAEEAGVIALREGAWRWASDDYPATTVSLRDIHDENFVIVDTSASKPRILGEIDFEGAHTTVYENAIYQHAAKLYEVHRLDYPERKAYVRAVDPEYFTQAIDQTRVFVLDVFDEPPASPTTAGHGEVRIATRFVGYKKIRFKTWENIGYGEINLPDLEKHTSSYWCTFDADAVRDLKLGERATHGGLLGISRLLHTVGIVHLMCASGDLLVTLQSRESDAWESHGLGANGAAVSLAGLVESAAEERLALNNGTLLEAPTVFLYDRFPGGVGFSERLFELHDTLLPEALALVRSCSCERGCPACVGPEDLVGPDGKRAAIAILDAVT